MAEPATDQLVQSDSHYDKLKPLREEETSLSEEYGSKETEVLLKKDGRFNMKKYTDPVGATIMFVKTILCIY